MDNLESDYSGLLRAAHKPPCISLYQPTHRHHPDSRQDQILFRNLVREIESALLGQCSAREARACLAPFEALASDREFWNHAREGLAVLAAGNVFRRYRLQRPTRTITVVADSFHTKPLIRVLQSADRYRILGISRQSMRLFEGNRDGIDEIEPAPGVPRTAADVIGEEAGGPERKARVYGPAAPGAASRHTTDIKEETKASDTERFFRAVDRAMMEHHSQPSGMPLLLAALPEHHHLFHSISRNPYLVTPGIDVYPDDLSPDELRERSWDLIQPRYLARLNGLIDRFRAGIPSGLAAGDLAQVAQAASAGRVGTLLIEAERFVPGTFDPTKGMIRLHDDAGGSGADDLLDDLAEHVLKTGGDVVVVPAERMPTDTGVAAIYRF